MNTKERIKLIYLTILFLFIFLLLPFIAGTSFASTTSLVGLSTNKTCISSNIIHYSNSGDLIAFMGEEKKVKPKLGGEVWELPPGPRDENDSQPPPSDRDEDDDNRESDPCGGLSGEALSRCRGYGITDD